MSGIVETIRLDKHKPDKRSEKGFNIFALLAILIVVLVLALNFEAVIMYFKTATMNRARSNAEAALERYVIEMGDLVKNRTLFIVEKSGKYYVLWYSDKVGDIVSYDSPEGSQKPFKAKQEYPFETSPLIEEKHLSDDGIWYYNVSIDTVGGFSMAENEEKCFYERFLDDKDWKDRIPKNVKMYTFNSNGVVIPEINDFD